MEVFSVSLESSLNPHLLMELQASGAGYLLRFFFPMSLFLPPSFSFLLKSSQIILLVHMRNTVFFSEAWVPTKGQTQET